MSLFNQVNEDIKKAMLAREKDKLEALRAIKAAFLLAKTEKGGMDELPSDVELKIIQKLIKQRRESADIYKQQNRTDLYDKEILEANVIETYLPAQMSDEELNAIIKGIVEKAGAKSPADFGKVMGIAAKELSGKADGKIISQKVKELLG
ncbi:MAG: GatB/YqeY domain-containing protein [Bacteroidales bacterium]|nr:GatB/YqeY domain-containing protein [Bacteroidales bacterium]